MPPWDVWFVSLFADFLTKGGSKTCFSRQTHLFGNKPGFGVAEIFQMEELLFSHLFFVILPFIC